MPAVYWRVDGGYQDAPEADSPPPPPLPCQPMMQFQNCIQNYPAPWMYQPCQPWPGYPQWEQPPAYVPAPIYIDGLILPPPEYRKLSPSPPDVDGCPPPEAPKVEKKDAKVDDGKKKEAKENLNAPPKMPAGCKYMYDKKHAMIHIFNKTHPVWESKYENLPQKFKMFKVSVNFTVKMVIENVLRAEGDACKGWAATEAVELGSGKWAKGSTIEYDSDKSNGKLKEMSWSEKRGEKLPPVWLVVHKN